MCYNPSLLNGLEGFFISERSFGVDFYVYLRKKKTTGEVFKGTRMEFKEKFGHTFDTLVQPKNPNKSCKGWRLVN